MMFFLFLLKTLIEAVLTSTHNLCFRAEIRKNVYPCKPQFYYIKVGCKGVYISRTCYHDEPILSQNDFILLTVPMLYF